MGTRSATMSTASALFGTVRAAVLGVLMREPDRGIYVREMVRAAGVGQGAVQRELANLVQMGVATRTRQGNQVLYRANHESPIFSELRSLIRKTVGVVDVLRAALTPLSSDISIAFIFGSVAKGTETPTSDIDIMLVGDVSLAQAVESIQGAQQTLEKEINPSVFGIDEFCRRVAAKDHFMSTVLKEPVIFLIGEENELNRLVGKGLVDSPQAQQSGNS